MKKIRAVSICVSTLLVGVSLACGLLPALAGVEVPDDSATKIAPPVTTSTTPPAPLLPATTGTGPQPIAKTKQSRKTLSIDEISEVAAPPAKKYVLRCWQQGLLILERHVDTLPRDSQKAIPVDGANPEAMRLFDLRNATCLMQ